MKRILITDDRPEILMLLKATLKAREFDILTAGNGREAIEAVEEKNPCLVILDVVMPEMDGFTACEIIKNNPETAHIPVILLTAKGQEFDRERGFAAGADEYIIKPFSPLEIISIVKKYVEEPEGVVS